MDVDLVVKSRSDMGKGAARRLRGQSWVPAVLYGPKTNPLPLAVPALRLHKLLRDLGEESRLIRLIVDEGSRQQIRQALIREVQTHPVRRQFLHVDFYEVPLDQPIVVEVPVEIVGESIGEKKGGILDVIRRTLAVRCLPGEIPEKIQIDVTSLDAGASLHVSDLVDRFPFVLVDDENLPVVAVTAPESAGSGSDAARG